VTRHGDLLAQRNAATARGRPAPSAPPPSSAGRTPRSVSLGITHVDAVRWNLLFERLLAPERDGYTDIDVFTGLGRVSKVVVMVGADMAACR
jgi:hypothetical protein